MTPAETPDAPATPTPPAGTSVNTTGDTTINNVSIEDQGHRFVWIALAISGLVLIVFGCALSTGLFGPAVTDRVFEFGLLLLSNAGFLKARSS